jgi:hypothetical protein
MPREGSGDPLSEAGPPPGNDSNTSSSGPQPIGVPEEYTTPRTTYFEDPYDEKFHRQAKSFQRDVKPRYFDGDEYIPANWPSTNIWEIQQALAKVGMLTGTFQRNVWDQATRNAYKELLGIANATGQTADRALTELLSTSDLGEDSGQWTVDEFGNIVRAGAGEGPPPLVTRTTDPGALRTTFRRAVIELLGEGWSQDKINNMVAAYNQMEVQRQTEAYNEQYGVGVEAGGTVTDIPTPEEFVTSQVTEQDPAGMQANEGLGFIDQFMDVASRPAWGIS